MPKIKLEGSKKLLKLRITIKGEIEIDDLGEYYVIEECLNHIREYGSAEIIDTEIIEN